MSTDIRSPNPSNHRDPIGFSVVSTMMQKNIGHCLRRCSAALLVWGITAHAATSFGDTTGNLVDYIKNHRAVYAGKTNQGGVSVLMLESPFADMHQGQAGMTVNCGSGSGLARGAYTYSGTQLTLTSRPSSLTLQGGSCVFTFAVKPGAVELLSEKGSACPALHSPHCDFGSGQTILHAENPGPSFSCWMPPSKIQTHVTGSPSDDYKRLICSNIGLSYQEQIIMQTYARILSAYRRPLDRSIEQSSQQAWIDQMRLCHTVECVSKAMSRRMADFVLDAQNLPLDLRQWVIDQSMK